MAGIPTEGTDEDGNVILPGLTVDGTGASTDNVTGAGQNYSSTAGQWGSFGPQVNNFSNLTEGYVRNILSANIGSSDAWMQAWAGLCNLIAEFPLFAGLIDLIEDPISGIHALLGGAQQFIDTLLNTVTCGLYSQITPEGIIDAITGVFDNIKNLLGIDIEWTLAQIFEWATDILNCIGGLIGGAANAVGQTVQGIIDLLTDIVSTVLGLFGINGDTIQHLIAEVQNWINCIGGWVFGIANATGQTIKGIFDGIGAALTTVLGWFGINANTIPAALAEIQNWINCIGGWVFGIANATGQTLKGIFDQIGSMITSILNMFGINEKTIPNAVAQIQTWINCIGEWVGAAAQGTVHSVLGVFNAISTLMTNVLNAMGINEQSVSAIISQIRTWIDCIWRAVEGVTAGAGKTITEVFTSVQGLLANLFGSFAPGTVLPDLVAFVSDLISSVGMVINNVIVAFPTPSQVIDFLRFTIDIFWNFFSWLLGGPTGFLGKSLYDLFTMFGDWANTAFGGLVRGAFSIITQVASVITGVGMDLITNPLGIIQSFLGPLATGTGDLFYNIINNFAILVGQTADSFFGWLKSLLNVDGVWAFIQSVWGKLISFIPIGNVGHSETEKVNLLTLGEFKNSTSVQALNGWSWDSSANRTGGAVGGSAKLDCSVVSGTKTLYSNQNIRVVPGDQLACSAYIRTGLTYTGVSDSLIIGVVPFAGTVQKPMKILAYGNPTNAAWVNITNDSSPWTIPKYSSNPSGWGTTAADQITSVQVYLSVAANQGEVWWDDIMLYKTGFLQQGLVDNLPGAFSGIYDGLNGNPSGTTVLPAASLSTMYTAATNPTGLVGTASTNASLAKDNTQKVVNAVATTVGGVSSTGDQPATEVAGHFGSFFEKLYGAGNTKPQPYVPQGTISNLPSTFGGMYDAFKNLPLGTTPTVSGTASTFHTAVTAQGGYINTAYSNADTAKTNVQNTIDNIARTVGGNSGAVNQTSATVSTNFASFFQKLYGQQYTTPQTYVPQTTINNLPGTFGGMLDAFNKQPYGTNGSVSGTGSGLYTSVTGATGLIGTAASNADAAKTAAEKADAIAIAVASSNNLILSPDFEDATISRVAANAGLNISVSYSTTSGTYRSGSQSLKLYANNSVNSNSTGQWGGVYLAPIKSDGSITTFMIAPGQVYSYDIYVLATGNGSGLSGAVQFGIYDYTGANIQVGNAATSLVNNSWVRINGTYTIPNLLPGRTTEPISMRPTLALYGAINAGNTFYVDRAIIYR